MSDIDRGTDRAGRRKKRFLALGRARQVRIARPDRCARTGGVNGGAPGTEVVPPGMRLVRSTSDACRRPPDVRNRRRAVVARTDRVESRASQARSRGVSDRIARTRW